MALSEGRVSDPQAAGLSPHAVAHLANFYGDWTNVQLPAIHAMDRYVTESIMRFPGGLVEARQCAWSHPLESICTTNRRCYMIQLMLSGRLDGGTVTNLQAAKKQPMEHLGRLYLVPPDQALRFNSEAGNARSICCILDAELFESFLSETPHWRGNERALEAALNISGGQIEWLLRRMHRELRHPDFATPQMIETLARQLSVEIIRALKLRQEDGNHHAGGLAPWRLRLIRQRLDSEDVLPDLNELANLCDMTVRHLSRAFRSETGQTIGRQVETVMADRASRMLRRGTSVREVAAALGYATSGSFATAFRRATGLLPSEVNTEAKSRTPRPN